jgi:hypothetical protein
MIPLLAGKKSSSTLITSKVRTILMALLKIVSVRK